MGIADDLALFMRRYEALNEDDPRRIQFRLLYDAIKTAQFEDHRSWIELSYGKLYLDELYEYVEGPWQARPVVFLNMCESAQVVPTLSDSFIHFFLNRGAASVIGTECPMTVEFAHPFALWCFEGLIAGETLGLAILRARQRAIALKNPLGLAYTLFGSDTTHYEFRGPGQAATGPRHVQLNSQGNIRHER